MSARLILIAAAALAAATAAAAEPAKAPVQQPEKPAKVVLASADEVRAPAPTADRANSAPAKRARRVTTCRCADRVEQQPEP